MVKCRLLFFIIPGIICTICRANEINIGEFIENASIRYKTNFNIDTTLEQWNRILNNPVPMGKLWEIYRFSPPYKVNSIDSHLHVIDPTGIEGDLVEIQSTENNRIYYGRGTMKNWCIPISLAGKAIFIVNHVYSHDAVSVTLNIYGEGGSDIITKLLLKAVSPVIVSYINRRVTRNLRDLKSIVADIEHNPEKIRSLLNSDILTSGNQLSNR